MPSGVKVELNGCSLEYDEAEWFRVGFFLTDCASSLTCSDVFSAFFPLS